MNYYVVRCRWSDSYKDSWGRQRDHISLLFKESINKISRLSVDLFIQHTLIHKITRIFLLVKFLRKSIPCNFPTKDPYKIHKFHGKKDIYFLHFLNLKISIRTVLNCITGNYPAFHCIQCTLYRKPSIFNLRYCSSIPSMNKELCPKYITHQDPV